MRGFGESKHSMKMGTPELTGHERGIFSSGVTDSNRYEGIPPCPDGLKEICYKKGKRAYIMKGISWELNELLHNDVLYGKSTLTRCVFTNTEGREVKYSCVYKGIKWQRLQYICDKWGVKLIEVET